MQEVLATVERVAPTNSTVLLAAKSGVAKTSSPAPSTKNRAALPAIYQDQQHAIPRNLLESATLLARKGAFTGAIAASRANSSLPTKARFPR